jgi:N-acetylglutamate synthase-like GNAT family acetyltransferase
LGFFGPLSVRPDIWDHGIGKGLLEPVMELFVEWGTKHASLFTFAHSPKHMGLYQKFGFWPRFLTVIMSKPVEQPKRVAQWSRYSEVPDSERAGCLSACRRLTDAICEGLDLEREIGAVYTQGLGDTVLLWDDSTLVGLGICHCGPGSEAGSGACYVKFGGAQPGTMAGQVFDRLLDACEALASQQGMSRLIAGVNTENHHTYRKMMARGFRTQFQGITMHRPNEPAYNGSNVYVVDDWR